MKKTIRLAVVAALALGATSAFATNGSALIGTGAKARGMGGLGIAKSHGAESALVNPALISTVEGTQVQFAGTIFMPDVKTNTGAGAGAKESDADMSVIPSVSIASKINDNFHTGIGIWGTAGLGVDYRNDASNFNMVTNLQLMQFGVPLVYSTGGLSVGITPILQYGSLDIGFKSGTTTIGAGVAQDLQFGYNAGLTYAMGDLTVGASYKSQIDMNYKDQLPTALGAFQIPGAANIKELSTPAEMGVGISYKMGASTIALDYKQINWSEAEGYKVFNWKDQDVYVIGYEYAGSEWSFRLGYNHAASPIEAQAINTGGILNALNLLGFPATVDSHITAGTTVNLSKQTSVDFALAYAPETDETFQHTAFTTNPASPVIAPINTKHSQTSVSLGLNYAF